MMYKYILGILILCSVMLARQAVAQLNPNKLTHYSELDGTICMLTNNHILHALNPQTGEVGSWSMEKLIDSTVDPFFANDILIDSTNNIWIGTDLGLIYFDREMEKFEVFEESQGEKYVCPAINSLRFDSFGNLWLGTPSSGLLKYNDRSVLESIVHKMDDNQAITSRWVTRIFESSDGLIWLATSGGGLTQGINAFDPETGRITPITYLSFLVSIILYIN